MQATFTVTDPSKCSKGREKKPVAEVSVQITGKQVCVSSSLSQANSCAMQIK